MYRLSDGAAKPSEMKAIFEIIGIVGDDLVDDELHYWVFSKVRIPIALTEPNA